MNNTDEDIIKDFPEFADLMRIFGPAFLTAFGPTIGPAFSHIFE
jgi:hypothetical protein